MWLEAQDKRAAKKKEEKTLDLSCFVFLLSRGKPTRTRQDPGERERQKQSPREGHPGALSEQGHLSPWSWRSRHDAAIGARRRHRGCAHIVGVRVRSPPQKARRRGRPPAGAPRARRLHGERRTRRGERESAREKNESSTESTPSAREREELGRTFFFMKEERRKRRDRRERDERKEPFLVSRADTVAYKKAPPRRCVTRLSRAIV